MKKKKVMQKEEAIELAYKVLVGKCCECELISVSGDKEKEYKQMAQDYLDAANILLDMLPPSAKTIFSQLFYKP